MITRRAWLAGTLMAQLANSEPLDPLAERYVKLALALGQHDPDYIDAYYGPAPWKDAAAVRKMPLASILTEGKQLETEMLRTAVPTDELGLLRRRFLAIQTRSLIRRAELLNGRKMTFDQESQALYDAVAPSYGESGFESSLKKLEKLIPGSGPLSARYEEWQKRFTIPKERLDRVIGEVTDEARRRTKAHIALPADENFVREFVTGKVWTGYNWYKGNARSLIQINTDLPMEPLTAIRMACHEGYPGHHVYNTLLEDRLMRKRGWVEISVYPLFSPQSLIAEGTADYGVDLTFPAGEIATYYKDALFPGAGLDRSTAAEYQAVKVEMENLGHAQVEAARRYIDGAMNRAQCEQWLQRFAAQTPARSQQQVRFFDKNRSYIINYSYGRDLIAAYMRRRVPSGQTAAMWREFEALLSSPRLPSGLA
jgi:hypothetical protein